MLLDIQRRKPQQQRRLSRTRYRNLGVSADLRVDASVSPTSAAVGAAVTVVCDVENTGEATASGADVFAFLSDGGSNQQELGRRNLGSLSGGASRRESFTTTVPSWAPSGGVVGVICGHDFSDATPANNASRVELQIDQEQNERVNVAVVSVSVTPSSVELGRS